MQPTLGSTWLFRTTYACLLKANMRDLSSASSVFSSGCSRNSGEWKWFLFQPCPWPYAARFFFLATGCWYTKYLFINQDQPPWLFLTYILIWSSSFIKVFCRGIHSSAKSRLGSLSPSPSRGAPSAILFPVLDWPISLNLRSLSLLCKSQVPAFLFFMAGGSVCLLVIIN